MWLALTLFAPELPAKEYYSYTAPDGTVMLTDSPDHDGWLRWWDDILPGMYLPNGVPMPRLDCIRNLDAYDAAFLSAADANGLPAELLKAVAVAESRMNPDAVSPAGAKGLMQMIPSTARAMGVADIFSPTESIRGGSAYLAKQVEQFGSFEHALAAYNAGPGNVKKFNGIPPFAETRTYVARVMGLYAHFRDNARVMR